MFLPARKSGETYLIQVAFINGAGYEKGLSDKLTCTIPYPDTSTGKIYVPATESEFKLLTL